jgi:thioredoxin 2
MAPVQLICPECNTCNRIDDVQALQSAVCQHCQTALHDSFPLDVNDDACEAHIQHSSMPLILDFYSDYCGPCMAMLDDYEDASLLLDLKVRFLKINTDHHQKLAQKLGVNGVPCLIAFKGGNEIERVSRALSQNELTMWAEALLELPTPA